MVHCHKTLLFPLPTPRKKEENFYPANAAALLKKKVREKSQLVRIPRDELIASRRWSQLSTTILE